MKIKSQLLTIGILFFSISYSQEKFSTYEKSFGVKKTYKIEIDNKENNKFLLYIDAMSLDRVHESGGILIDQYQHQVFIETIEKAKIKYEEWITTAKENNVKDLNKKMEFSCKSGGYFLYGREWNLQLRVDLEFNFKIVNTNDSIDYLLLIKTGELQSSSNRFMKTNGVVLVFTSSKEVDDFINTISLNKITEFLSRPKKEAIFK